MPAAETSDGPLLGTGPAAAADAATRPHTYRARGSELAHARTVPAETAETPAPIARNRFTTVEELHRLTRQRAAAERRRQHVWQALAAVVTGAVILGGGYLMMRPRSADELYARIDAIAADEASDLRDARPLIEEFLSRHEADPRAAAVRDIDRRLEVDVLERKTRRRPRSDRALPLIERDYRAAMAREADSPAGCVAALEAILAVSHADATGGEATSVPDTESTALWLALVRRQIDRLEPLATREREEDTNRAKAVLAEAAELAGASAAASAAERSDLVARRRKLLEGLVELNASRPHMATFVAEARRLLGDQATQPTSPAPPEPQP